MISFLVFCFFSALYLLTPNQIFSFDAVTNAIACESNELIRWFHPNHPLYPFLGVLWYRLEKLWGYHGFAIYSLARFNSLLMAGSLALLHWGLKDEIGKARAAAWVIFLGVTYACWHYAVDGRAIGASVFFSSLLVTSLIRFSKRATLKYHHTVHLGFLSSLYILCHGIAIFHVAAIAGWLLMRSRFNNEKRLNYDQAGLYLLTVAIVVSSFYLGVYAVAVKPWGSFSFLSWAVGYAGYEGEGKILESGFWFKNGNDFIDGIWRGWAQALVHSGTSFTLNFFTIFFALGLLGALFYSLTQFRKQKKERRLLALTLGAWGVFISIFLTLWSPGQEGFRLHILVPWIVMAALLTAHLKPVEWVVGSSAALVFWLNFSYTIVPASFIQNNSGYQILSEIQTHLQPGDVLVCGQSGIPGIEVLRPYFFPEIKGGSITGRLFAYKEKTLDPLIGNLVRKQTEGHHIYFTPDIFDPAVQQAIEGQFLLRKGEMAEFANRFEIKNSFPVSSQLQITQVEFKPARPVLPVGRQAGGS